MFDTVWQDLRHGARMLARNPGFAALAILSIAIGVGANAAMFSVADTILLRPLTLRSPNDVVVVTADMPQAGVRRPSSTALSYPEFIDIRDNVTSFAGLMAYRLVLVSFADRPDQPPKRRFGMAVNGGFFDAAGVQPAMGRPFGAEEDRVPGRDRVAVLAHDMWTETFGSDPGVVGRVLRIGGVDMTVVGVMPRGFTGPDQFLEPSFYVPAAAMPGLQNGMASDELLRRDLRNFVVKGRLKPGVAVSRANEEASLLGSNLARSFPDTNRNRLLRVMTELDSRSAARPQLMTMAATLLTLALVVLTVACANLAGLLSSRAPARARELALRMAVGAGRMRLFRQLLAESFLLAAGGALMGLGMAYAVIGLFSQMRLPTDVPLKLAFEVNERVVAMGVVVAILGAVASSLVPAWQSSRRDVITSLKNVSAVDTGRRRLWGRNALVVGQVALSLVLLTTGVFLFRGFQSELTGGLGFTEHRLLLMTFDPELIRYDGNQSEQFYRLLVERVRAMPGVRSATVTSRMPLDQINVDSTQLVPDGMQLPPDVSHVAVYSESVDDRYFDTLGIRLTDGRAFREADTTDTPRVAMVNEAFVERYWSGRDPIGLRVQVVEGDRGWAEVVGVVDNVTYQSLSERPVAVVYFPRAQRSMPQSTLVVATNGEPASLTTGVLGAIRALDPNMPVFNTRTFGELFESAVGLTRLLSNIVGGMGAMGLALAITGLYGLVAYAVSRRTREIGVRVAVGATSASVLRMVFGQGLRLVLAGTVLGTLASLGTSRLLRAAFPFPDMPQVDVVSYVIVVPAILLVTLLAAFVPAFRASRIDPLVALRTE